MTAMDKHTLVILGAGQQGRNCNRLAPLNGYSTVAFVDDFVDWPVDGIPVHKHIQDIPRFQEHWYIVAVGDLGARKKFIEQIDALNLKCANLIDPTADIEEGAKIGKGNYIYKFASIYASATVGDHNIINCKAVLATDSVVGNNCNICMGSNLCGDVHVGDNSYVGYNATVVSGHNVGKNAKVEAGAVVMEDVDDGDYVSGIPAKSIRKTEGHHGKT